MFCPGCGIEEKQSNQFCRACGTDLRAARRLLEIPDSITASATNAREEIGRAFAAKIREAEGGHDLKIVAEDVLPEIEKFLESPAEKRLRRMRVGTLIAFIGAGAALGFGFGVIFVQKDEFFFLMALGIVALFIGLGFVVNGHFLTVPKTGIADRASDADDQRRLDAANAMIEGGTTSDLKLPAAQTNFVSSVTEETTRTLGRQPVDRE